MKPTTNSIFNNFIETFKCIKEQEQEIGSNLCYSKKECKVGLEYKSKVLKGETFKSWIIVIYLDTTYIDAEGLHWFKENIADSFSIEITHSFTHKKRNRLKDFYRYRTLSKLEIRLDEYNEYRFGKRFTGFEKEVK